MELKMRLRKVNGVKAGEYGKELMKIKFISDNNLSLNKLLMLYMLTIVVRSIFE